MRYGRTALWLAFWMCLFQEAARAWPEERPATNKFTCQEVQVPMRDGVKLAADLYVPEGQGPFPVVIERTPYNKNNCEFRYAPYFAERGYAVLIQDVRGRYGSPGVFYQFRDEGWGARQDGYDTIEWAGKQSWSNGNVGMMGSSYSCLNQTLTAPTQPPSWKAGFCSDSAANWYKEHRYPGGAFHSYAMSWYLGQNNAVQPILENYPGGPATTQDWLKWHVRRIERGLSFWDSWMSPAFYDQMSHTTYDAYWKQFAADEHIEKFTVPTYYTSGWYDNYPHSVTKLFNEIRKRAGSQKARESVRLLIGPWTHGGGRGGQQTVGDLDFGADAAVNMPALQLRWFDYHLRGMDNGIMKEPAVRIFVMGENKWREENEWPIARAVETKFYLSPDKSGSIESLNDGSLSKMTAQGGSNEVTNEVTFVYDPKDPVPSIGGDLFVQPAGPRDHRPADRRSLTFTTPPFQENVEISGPSSVELHVSSTADDTDFVVTLTDVRPDGYSLILRQAVLRASRRESLENPTPIEPAKVYKLTIPIHPVSNVFLAGHRLRLSVTSSSFPKYLPNHNKFMVNNEESPWVTARNTLYHDAQRPSVLIVPVIPQRTAGR